MKLNFFKIQLVALFLIAATTGFAQADSVIAIPGSKCKMAPPKGFTVAENFSGFQNLPIGASIMITEIPSNYIEILNGFNTENLQKAGIVLVNKSEILVNEIPVHFFTLTQMANNTQFKKYVFIFGNDKETIMINGIFPESEKDADAAILKSMKTIQYNKDVVVDGKQVAQFSLDETGSGLLYSGYMQGALMYSQDGKMPTNSADKAVFTAAGSLSNTPITDKKEYTEKRLKGMPRGSYNTIKSTSPITINGINGYEIIAEGKDNDNKPQLVYLVMLYPENNSYYILVGMTSAKFETYLPAFQQMAKTFKLK